MVPKKRTPLIPQEAIARPNTAHAGERVVGDGDRSLTLRAESVSDGQ